MKYLGRILARGAEGLYEENHKIFQRNITGNLNKGRHTTLLGRKIECLILSILPKLV